MTDNSYRLAVYYYFLSYRLYYLLHNPVNYYKWFSIGWLVGVIDKR